MRGSASFLRSSASMAAVVALMSAVLLSLSSFALVSALPDFGPMHMSKVVRTTSPVNLYATAPSGTTRVTVTWAFPASNRGVAFRTNDEIDFLLPSALSDSTTACALLWNGAAIPTVQTSTTGTEYRITLTVTAETGGWALPLTDVTTLSATLSLQCSAPYPLSPIAAMYISPRVLRDTAAITTTLGALIFPPVMQVIASVPQMSHNAGVAGVPGSLVLEFSVLNTAGTASLFPLGEASNAYFVMDDAAAWTFPSTTDTPCTVATRNLATSALTVTGTARLVSSSSTMPTVRLDFDTHVLASARLVITCPGVTPPAIATSLPRRTFELGLYLGDGGARAFAVIDAVRFAIAAPPTLGADTLAISLSNTLVPVTASSTMSLTVTPLGVAPPTTSATATARVVLRLPTAFALGATPACTVALASSAQVGIATTASALETNAWQFDLPTTGWTAATPLQLVCTNLVMPAYLPTDLTAVLTVYNNNTSPDAAAAWVAVARASVAMPALSSSFGTGDASAPRTVTLTPPNPAAGSDLTTLQIAAALPANIANVVGNVLAFSLPVSEQYATLQCALYARSTATETDAPVPTTTAEAQPVSKQDGTGQVSVARYSIKLTTLPPILRLSCTGLRSRTIAYSPSDLVAFTVYNSDGNAVWRTQIAAPEVQTGTVALNTVLASTGLSSFSTKVDFSLSSANVYIDSTVALRVQLPTQFDLSLLSKGLVCTYGVTTLATLVLTHSSFFVQLQHESSYAFNTAYTFQCTLVLPDDALTARIVTISPFRAPSSLAAAAAVSFDTLVRVSADSQAAFGSYSMITTSDYGGLSRQFLYDLPYTGSEASLQISFAPYQASLSQTSEYLIFDLPAQARVPPNGGRCTFWYNDVMADAEAVTVTTNPASATQTVRVEPVGVISYSITANITLACDITLSQEPVVGFGDLGFTHVNSRSGLTVSTYYGSNTSPVAAAPMGFTTATPAVPFPRATDEVGVTLALIRDPSVPLTDAFTYGTTKAALRLLVEGPNTDLLAGDSMLIELPPRMVVAADATAAEAISIDCKANNQTVALERPYILDALSDGSVEISYFSFVLTFALNRFDTLELVCRRDGYFTLSDSLLIESPTLTVRAYRASAIAPGLVAANADNLVLSQPVPAITSSELTLQTVVTPGGPDGLANVTVLLDGLNSQLTLPLGSRFVFSLPGEFLTVATDLLSTKCRLFFNELGNVTADVTSDPDADPDASSALPVMIAVATHELVTVGSVVTGSVITVPVTTAVRTDSDADSYVLYCDNVIYPARQAADSARRIAVYAASGYTLIETSQGAYAGITGPRLTLYITHETTFAATAALLEGQVKTILSLYPLRLTGVTFTTHLSSHQFSAKTGRVVLSVALLGTGATSRDALSVALETRLSVLESEISGIVKSTTTTTYSGYRDYDELCFNGERDSNEADVDCGNTCFACAVGDMCFSDSDCGSGYCTHRLCVSSRDNAAPAHATTAALALAAAVAVAAAFVGV